jgi:hypothetical protein
MKNLWRRYWDKVKARRNEWNPVLQSEVKKWSAMSCARVMSMLPESECYEVEVESRKYQVEVELLEDTEQYIHIGVSVDDGTLPASFRPASSSFIRNKDASNVPSAPRRQPQK